MNVILFFHSIVLRSCSFFCPKPGMGVRLRSEAGSLCVNQIVYFVEEPGNVLL